VAGSVTSAIIQRLADCVESGYVWENAATYLISSAKSLK
jgi:hypothetical protein